MKQLKAKVYYLKIIGKVLAITSEMQWAVLETTKEQDIQIFPAVQNKSLDEIDFVELEYGTLLQLSIM